ncbi:MAG TPA: fluoride efflux transporter CrcB [Sutterella sp.]|nr:fluoride efflux transporter CrcB [Sutterella sp.]
MREGSILIALLAVGLGAAAGACVRWALSEALNSRLSFIPAGTLAANLIGAFAIGVLLALFAGRPVSPQVKLFLMTGLLGGLTTFSTFSSENVQMLLAGEYLRSVAHAAVHLFGSLASTALGFAAGKHFF